MQIKPLMLGAIASIVTLFPTPARAQSLCWSVPNLSFSNSSTYVSLNPYADSYHGSTSSGVINLYGSQCTKNSTYERQGWTWWNGNVSYSVYWRPYDPNYARLVVRRGGTVLSNQLLYIAR